MANRILIPARTAGEPPLTAIAPGTPQPPPERPWTPSYVVVSPMDDDDDDDDAPPFRAPVSPPPRARRPLYPRELLTSRLTAAVAAANYRVPLVSDDGDSDDDANLRTALNASLQPTPRDRAHTALVASLAQVPRAEIDGTRLVDSDGDSNEFICVCCLNVVEEPVAQEGCAHIVCRTCFRSILVNSEGVRPCPTCRAPNRKAEPTTAHWMVKRVWRLRVHCAHRILLTDADASSCTAPPYEIGVDYAGEKAHRAVCNYEQVPCELGCGAQLRRRELAQHVVESCAARRVQCELCTDWMSPAELKAHQIPESDPLSKVLPCRGFAECEFKCTEGGDGDAAAAEEARNKKTKKKKTEPAAAAAAAVAIEEPSSSKCQVFHVNTQMAAHRLVCPRRPVQCEICKADMPAAELARHKKTAVREHIDALACQLAERGSSSNAAAESTTSVGTSAIFGQLTPAGQSFRRVANVRFCVSSEELRNRSDRWPINPLLAPAPGIDAIHLVMSNGRRSPGSAVAGSLSIEIALSTFMPSLIDGVTWCMKLTVLPQALPGDYQGDIFKPACLPASSLGFNSALAACPVSVCTFATRAAMARPPPGSATPRVLRFPLSLDVSRLESCTPATDGFRALCFDLFRCA